MKSSAIVSAGICPGATPWPAYVQRDPYCAASRRDGTPASPMPITTASPPAPMSLQRQRVASARRATATLIVAGADAAHRAHAIVEIGRHAVEVVRRHDDARGVAARRCRRSRPFDCQSRAIRRPRTRRPARARASRMRAPLLLACRRTGRLPTSDGRSRRPARDGPAARRPRRGRRRRRDAVRPCRRASRRRAPPAARPSSRPVTVSHSSECRRHNKQKRLFNRRLKRRWVLLSCLCVCQTLAAAPSVAVRYHHQ